MIAMFLFTFRIPYDEAGVETVAVVIDCTPVNYEELRAALYERLWAAPPPGRLVLIVHDSECQAIRQAFSQGGDLAPVLDRLGACTTVMAIGHDGLGEETVRYVIAEALAPVIFDPRYFMPVSGSA